MKTIDMLTIESVEFIIGTSDEQVRTLVKEEDWAKEWYDKDLFLVEQPQHTLRLPAFEIARIPVTNGLYHLFVWNSGHQPPSEWNGFYAPDGLEDHPVAGVSKEEAIAFCSWLSKESGKQYRLPTECEWESAARGVDGRLYPWGQEFNPWRCNTVESGKRGTTPVAAYSPGGDSPWGAADMAGNVWEWTSSFLKPYPYRGDDGREEDIKGVGDCVVRGGAWYYSRKLARCASREGVISTYVSPALGFRVACSL